MFTNLDQETFKKFLDKDYDIKNFDWNTLVEFGTYVIESKELHQKVLGRMCAEMNQSQIEDMAKAITDGTGYKVTPSSLRQYRWVWSKIGKLDMPADLPWTAWRELAGTDNPEYWIERVVKDGLNASELKREIRITRGQPLINLTECPNCGFKFTKK